MSKPRLTLTEDEAQQLAALRKHTGTKNTKELLALLLEITPPRELLARIDDAAGKLSIPRSELIARSIEVRISRADEREAGKSVQRIREVLALMENDSRQITPYLVQRYSASSEGNGTEVNYTSVKRFFSFHGEEVSAAIARQAITLKPRIEEAIATEVNLGAEIEVGGITKKYGLPLEAVQGYFEGNPKNIEKAKENSGLKFIKTAQAKVADAIKQMAANGDEDITITGVVKKTKLPVGLVENYFQENPKAIAKATKDAIAAFVKLNKVTISNYQSASSGGGVSP